MVDVERRLFQAGFEDWRDVQARGDHRLEVFEEVALVVLRQTEDRHASDMHWHFRRFQIQKRRVHGRQLPGVAHRLLPRTTTLRLEWRFLFLRTVPSNSDYCQDCARSGGAYAMAKGPDRSNWLN